jgi:hypothetical protein
MFSKNEKEGNDSMRCKKEKSLYESPKILVSEFDEADIITTSGPLADEEKGNNYIDPWGWT